MSIYPTPAEKLNADSRLSAIERNDAAKRIKRKLDRAVGLLEEARMMAREHYPRAYVFCEGSGRIYVRTELHNAHDSRDVWVTSKKGVFDAGGW